MNHIHLILIITVNVTLRHSQHTIWLVFIKINLSYFPTPDHNLVIPLWKCCGHTKSFTLIEFFTTILYHIMNIFWCLFLMKQDIIYSSSHWIRNTSQSARRGILNNMSLDDWRSLGIDFKVVELCNIRLHSSGQGDIYKQDSLLPQIRILWTIVTYIHDSFEP